MEKNITLEQEISALMVKIADLDQRISKLESDGSASGIYLEGVPENIKNYIAKKNGDK